MTSLISRLPLIVPTKAIRGMIVAVAMLLLMGSSQLMAQTSGQISGTVSDPQGAVVAKAPVELKNTDTNATRIVTTDGAGLYSFTNLQPGHYEVTSTPPGFSPYKTVVLVEVGGQYTANIKLNLSGTSSVVEVSTESVQVNTATAEVSQVITSEQVAQLPSLTRNPYDFVELAGNVSSGDNSSPTNYQNGPTSIRGVGFNVNGGRASGTEILLDGVENISVFSEGISVRVPVDSVQEYRIVTNNFLPEYGRASGGIISVATKAGTNHFHGTAWEYNRLSSETANTVSNAQAGLAKGIYTRNQFGAEVAGPILKDKLFFEGTVEFLRVRSGAKLIAVIPTSQLLAAAAPNVSSFFSTYGGSTNGSVLSTTTNIQAGGGTTPLYTSLAPSLPIFNVISFTAPADAGGGAPENRYNIVGRVDYDLSQKTQMFFRYSDDHEIDQAGYAFASPYSQYNVGQSNIAQTYLLSAAHEFSPSLTTVAKLSFSRANLVNDTFNPALANVPTLYISSGAADPYSGKPFQLPGFFDTQTGTGGLPAGGPQNTIQYNHDVNLLKGRHALQGGAQIIYIQMNESYGAYAQANEILGSSLAKGLQAFLGGSLYRFSAAVNPNGATPCAKNAYTGVLTQTAACSITLPVGQPVFARSDRYHDSAAYVQDQFKVAPNLTIDYGVRYEYFGIQHNNHANLDANFFYGTGPSLQAQIRSGKVLTVPNSPIHKLWNPQYGTVSPRVGFALDVFGNGKTSLRAGYGISYERNFGNVTFNIIQNPPNYAVVVISPSVVTNSNSGPFAGSAGTSVPLPPTSLRHVDQNIRTAQTQFHSLSVDQQLGHNTVLEITYNGSRGLHLYDIKNYNIPGSGNLYLGDPIKDPVSGKSALTPLNSQFSNDNNRGSNGDSYYNGLNVQLDTRNLYRSGVSIIANYTYAHSLDDLSTTFSEDSVSNFGLGYTNAFNPALDHASSDYDVRHRFVMATIYKMPTYFKDKPGYVRELLGGYELTGILTMRTGTPFSFFDSTTNSSGYQTPRYNPLSPITHTLFKSIPAGATNTGNLYALTGATTLPVNVPFGNPALNGISDLGPYPASMSARNVFRGPGAYNLDCSISKQFPIREGLNVELRAESFDVTNHHNLYIQESLTDAASYDGVNPQIFGSKGGIGNNGGANDERRFLQFAAKINF